MVKRVRFSLSPDASAKEDIDAEKTSDAFYVDVRSAKEQLSQEMLDEHKKKANAIM